MNNVMNMPALLAANGMTMNERLSEAGVMVVLGMLMVFSVLAIIMIVLMIMERVFANKGKSEAEMAPAFTDDFKDTYFYFYFFVRNIKTN